MDQQQRILPITLPAGLHALADNYLAEARAILATRSAPGPPRTEPADPAALVTLALRCIEAAYQHRDLAAGPHAAALLVDNRVRLLTTLTEFVAVPPAPNAATTPEGSNVGAQLDAMAMDAIARTTSVAASKLPASDPGRFQLALAAAAYLHATGRTGAAVSTATAALADARALGAAGPAYALAAMLAHHLLPWSRATEFWRTDLVATVCPLAGPTAHALLVLHATLGMAARAAAAPADDWTAAETLLAYFDSVAPAAATATTQGMVGAAEPLTRAVACLGVLLELRAGNTAAARSRLDHLLVLHAAIEQRDATPNAGPVAVSGERCVVSVPNAPSALSTAPTAESAQPQTPSSVPIVLWTGLGNHEWRAVVYLLAGLVGADAVTQSRAVEMIRGGLVVLASNPTAVRTPTLHMHLHLAAIQLSLSQSHVAQAAELLRGIAYLPVSPSPATLHLLLAQTFHAARSYGHALAHYDAVASHPTGNTPDAPSPAARMLARTSMAMILMTTPSEPSVETEAAAMAILAQATKAATRKATRDPGAAAVATALANVLAEKEIVARKRKMLEAMTLAAAHYHVQTLTTVLAGCIYASTHEIASAAQAWQTGSRLASANAAQGLGGLSAACLQAREAILRLDPTAGNPSHPDELELVHRQATESAQDRETGRAALGAMRLVRAANHP